MYGMSDSDMIASMAMTVGWGKKYYYLFERYVYSLYIF